MVRRMIPQPAQHLESMHSGHPQIQENQVWIWKDKSITESVLSSKISKQILPAVQTQESKFRADIRRDALRPSYVVQIVIDNDDSALALAPCGLPILQPIHLKG
jgi:hypothetical protein